MISVYLTLSHFDCLSPALCCPTHPYLIGAFSNTALLVVGYGVSLVWKHPAPAQALDGLTVWSLRPANETAEKARS